MKPTQESIDRARAIFEAGPRPIPRGKIILPEGRVRMGAESVLRLVESRLARTASDIANELNAQEVSDARTTD